MLQATKLRTSGVKTPQSTRLLGTAEAVPSPARLWEKPPRKQQGQAWACPFENSRQIEKSMGVYLEKLATASASVLDTSKMVISFVICRTSVNLAPRWQRRSDAPWFFAL